MHMAATKVWTLEEVDALPEDGNKYELLYGELLVSPAPGPRHELIAARLNELLVPYVSEHQLGLVFLPRSIVQRKRSRAEPDLSVRASFDPDLSWDDAPTPFLVVEILSPSNRRTGLASKRRYYTEIGVDEYWIANPARGVVMVVRPGHADVETSDTLTWHPKGAATPLTIDVRALFGTAR